MRDSEFDITAKCDTLNFILWISLGLLFFFIHSVHALFFFYNVDTYLMKTRHVGVSPLTRYVVKVSGMYFRFGFPEELPINSGMREREREREREGHNF